MPQSSPIPARQGKEKDVTIWRHHNRDWHWTYNLMIAGMVLGLFSLAFVGYRTEATYWFLIRLLVVCSLVGLVIPLRLYNRWWRFGLLEMVFFNFLAVGPLTCTLLLWANFLIHGEPYTDVYQVGKFTVEMAQSGHMPLHLIDKEGNLGEPVTVQITPGLASKITRGQVRIKKARGLLGYPIFMNAETVIR